MIKKTLKLAESMKISLILRIGVFGTFLGHGIFALGVKMSWVPFITFFGFSTNTAMEMLPIIGAIDIVVAVLALFLPMRVVFIYAFIWAFFTALMRPVVGMPIWDFVERTANWATPLAMIYLQGLPRNIKQLFESRERKRINN